MVKRIMAMIVYIALVGIGLWLLEVSIPGSLSQTVRYVLGITCIASAGAVIWENWC